MQLISIAHRIKIFQTTAGLKRRRSAYSNILFSDDATLLRATSSSHRNHQTSVCNNDARRYSSQINGRPLPLASNKYYRRGNTSSLYPDHYRSYGTQTAQYQCTQKSLPFQNLSAANVNKSQHRSPKPSHIKHDNTNQTLNAISKRLSFFFSDANLRHDAYARSILEKHDCRYLPLDVIMTFKSIQRWTDDSNVVLNAVDYMNDNYVNDNNSIKLTTYTSDDAGNVFIGRELPFHYDTSLKEAQKKIMLIEGWPSDRDTRRIEDRLWALLCTKSTALDGIKNNHEKNLIAYWNTDIGKGLKTIEFQTEEGAVDAWSNLERAARKNTPNSRIPNQFVITITEDADNYKEYQLTVQNISLVARTMTIDCPEDKLLTDEKEQILSLFEQKLNKSEEAVQIEAEVKHTASLIDYHTPAKTKWWADGNATPPLHRCVEAMDDIFHQHNNLPPPSREWLHEYMRSRRRQHGNIDKGLYEEQRLELCNDAANLISCIKHSIADGKIRGLGGKDAYLLSELLGRAMLIFSETPPPRGTHSRGRAQQPSPIDHDKTASVSPYEACLGVMDMLRSLNLDILSSHYACTIRAACHEARWEEASTVFLNQINGNDGGDSNDVITGGFSPINPTLGWDQPLEVGLYAVARDAWYKSLLAEQQQQAVSIDSPSKQVFDAAMKMCMISPSEQDRYVLAAGLALGRAGLWSECLDLATEPASISTYGPSITAAAMLACIESSRYTEAIEAFDYFMSGSQSVASEWQWSGGNITAVEPICRDLALQAMGNVSRGGYSEEARSMFGVIMEEGSPLSCDGLIGLMHTLENDGNWKESVQVLDRFMASNFNGEGPKWRIVPNVVQLQKDSANDELASETEVNNVCEEMLASVMRVCNNEGHFGLAAVLCTVTDKLCHESNGCVNLTNGEDAVQGILASTLKSNSVFEAYTHSLYGLGCKRIAERLIKESDDADIEKIVSIPKRMRQNIPKAESWIQAAKSIENLLEAKNAIQVEHKDLCPESYFLFERGLSRAMEYCNDSNQPSAALYLFHNAARTLRNKKDQHLTDRFKSFLGMGKQTNQNPREEIFTDEAFDFSGIEFTDSILVAIINAYIKLGRPDQALSTYNDAISQLESPNLMRQSSNSILEVLLEIDVDECVKSLDNRSSTPATFITIAKHLAANGVWHEIGEIYNHARRAGCVSEELGFIAMQAVNESELADGKIVVCRKIAEDVANTIGIDKDEWITSRYWEIKRYVGYHYARLLMNWNDPSTSKKSELVFAIKEMRSCSKQGTLTKNAPLMFIAQQGDLYSTDKKNASGKKSLSDRERRSVVNLILEACVEADRSNLLQKHTFTAHVARSLRKMNANKECIKIVRGLVAPFGKCHHQVAMEEAIYAATEERDYDSLELLMNKFEESGYDSSRLHI
ncbi:hypothetical protein ACHAWT_008784 [Skeletonema menzelii]